MIKKLSIIIPVFNEEKTVEAVLEKVLLQETGDWEKEIIVVNDGSTDSTEEKISNFSKKIRILKQPNNLGKGAAMATGFKVFTGTAVIIQDADLEYSPSDWPLMLKELENNPEITAVYGSRELSPERKGYFLNILGVRFLSFLINFLFHSKLTDSYTCYKLFRADFIKNIKIESKGFEIEAEITCKILKNKGMIKEIPISYSPRSFKQGKHIRFKDGLIGLKTILKFWWK